MKKFFYLIVSLCVISLLWVGMVWFAGKLSSDRWEMVFNQTNEYLSSHQTSESIYKLEWKQTAQSLTNTEYKIYLREFESAEAKKPIKQITLLQNIEHGLFPISELTQFNFSPIWNVATFTLPSNNIPKELIERAPELKSSPLASMTVKVGLNQSIDIKGELLPFIFKSENYPFQFDGGNFSAAISEQSKLDELNIHLNRVNVTGRSPWIPIGHIIQNFAEHTQSQQPHNLKFDQLDFTLLPNTIRQDGIPHAKIDVNNLEFKIYNYPILDFKKLTYDINEVEHNNFVDLENSFLLDDLHLYGLIAGSGEATFVTLHKTNDEAITFYKSLAGIFYDDQFKRKDISEAPSFNEFMNDLGELITKLAKNPGYQIVPFKWTTESGELTAKTELIFSHDATVVSNNDSPFSNINSFYLDIEADRGVIPELVTIYDQLSGIDKQIAFEKNKQLLDDNIRVLSNFGVIDLQDNKVDFTFSYGENLFGLNGVIYSQSQFIEYLSILSTLQRGLISSSNLIEINDLLNKAK